MKTIVKRLWIMVLPMLLSLVFCSCDNDDKQLQEKDLIGLWWDAYKYSGVTETGVPFNQVLLAVKADADHTGCIYLAVFDNDYDKPLAIYGGPKDAGFTWHLLEGGKLLLGDPATGESYAMVRTRGDGNSYGEGMTDVANTGMAYTGDNMTLTNDNYSGTLVKADAEKEAEIKKLLEMIFTEVNAGETGIGLGGPSDNKARARRDGSIE